MKKCGLNVINEKILTKLGACEEGKNWFSRNIKVKELPVEKLKHVEGDYNGYVAWLKRNLINTTHDRRVNMLTCEKQCEFHHTGSYDNYGNELRYENADGLYWSAEYDEKGNMLTFENSYNFSFVKTYDEKGNVLTYEDSSGMSWTRTYTTTDTEFVQTLNGEVEIKVKF